MSSENKKFNLKIIPEKKVIFDSFENNSGYVRMDISGNINLMDEKAKEILGYDNRKEKVNARTMIHKDDFAYTMKSFMELYKTGEFKNYNARVSTKNGVIKKVQIDTKIIYNAQKKPVGAHGVIKEVFTSDDLKK